jgi:exopolyphosphatase/guanosine-5'-triphosphate,3'-diphosphate pyrophosphatase
VIGTSGTILSLGALAGDLKPSDDVRNVRVSAKALHRLRKRITAMTLEERLLLPNLDPRRADLAPAGAVLLDVLLKGLGATELTLCDFALREGLILDYIQRNAAHIRTVERYPDVRRRSVIELAERYNYYPAHAAQVARLALTVFDATKEKHGLGAREREWLEYGALLHDIGTHISYERHHRHSHYLISHGGLRGFEPEEIAVIGLIARYHRQALPRKSHEGFADLSRERRQAVRVLGALVRLAEGLDRSHVQVVTGLAFAPTDDALLVRVHGTGDADLEMWAADRHAAPLTDLLGIPLRFEFAGPLPAAAPKDAASHARHARNAAHVPGAPVRGRRHRRVGKNDTARPARKVAGRQRPPRVRD